VGERKGGEIRLSRGPQVIERGKEEPCSMTVSILLKMSHWGESLKKEEEGVLPIILPLIGGIGQEKEVPYLGEVSLCEGYGDLQKKKRES